MLTKKEMCELIIDEFKDKNPDIDKVLPHHIFQSSCLAVAMEYLGLLDDNPELKEYSKYRAGVIFTYVRGKKVKFLSLREILEFLPDD